MQPSRILSALRDRARDERWHLFTKDRRVIAARARLTAARTQARNGVVRVVTTARQVRPTFADQHLRTARAWVGRRLPRRFHSITHELAKFGTIGVVNLGVNFAVVNLLWFTILSGSQVKAKAVATVVAATSAYFMNRHWTYRDRPKSTLRREYTLFFFFNLVGLVIEVAVLYLAKYGLHQTHLLVLNLFTAIGIILGTGFRFWAYRTHVFKLAPVEGAEEAAIATPYEVVETEIVDPDEPLDDDLLDAELLEAELAQVELAQVELAQVERVQVERVQVERADASTSDRRGTPDKQLRDELTQIELETIVSDERSARTP